LYPAASTKISRLRRWTADFTDSTDGQEEQEIWTAESTNLLIRVIRVIRGKILPQE
jgi:hypothetical protein